MNPTTSADALSQLQGFQSSRKKPQDVLKESQTRLGIPSVQQRQVGLRSAIGNTENLIRGVDPSVTGRTSGSLVTEAQKQRLVSLERQPLDETFRTQSQALQGEETNLANLERNALTEAQLAMSADDQQQNNLQGIYSMLYQREADERARQEREAEARRQAQAQAQYLQSLLGGNGGGGGGDTETPPKPDLASFGDASNNYGQPVNDMKIKSGIPTQQLNGKWYDAGGNPVTDEAVRQMKARKMVTGAGSVLVNSNPVVGGVNAIKKLATGASGLTKKWFGW